MKQLFAKSSPEWTTLEEHTNQVALMAVRFAEYLKLDSDIARNGAILHDLGKAHPYFQSRLLGKTNKSKVFRHEISSLFFLSIFPREHRNQLIEMVVGHHKSIKNDVGEKGLLDLEENDDYIEFHLGNWEEWSVEVNLILSNLFIENYTISREEALENLTYCIEYCEQEVQKRGYSSWRGLLMGADHFASALIYDTSKFLNRTFKSPDLSFYNRTHELYPLSKKSADSIKKHTLVVASTGAGKTDYLFRRCSGRVFFTLPFQASINAMFKRVAIELEKDNPDLDIRVLHSTSSIVKRNNNEEVALQNLIGSAIKILTPHQLTSILFGLRGYEALILDLKGCDVILDEVHTYSGISQALVLKLIEILNSLECRIHIGTATMPSVLYQRIKNILGQDVLEVKLEKGELDEFDRHKVFKIKSYDEAQPMINDAIKNNQKILIVLNKVKNAQEVYSEIKENHPTIPSLLLHSRFKRGDRNLKENELIGLDDDGVLLGRFNTSKNACIVVSTQIVEVSLDISFDLMITETAPLDAMIQRFGRINRKRTKSTIGTHKNIYIIAPGKTISDARPYDLEILQKSYETLMDGEVLKERSLQNKIDSVFTSIDFSNIEEHSVYKSDGTFTLDKLTHHSKSILFELLQIDSVACIVESDEDKYNESNFEDRLHLEIPVYYYSVAKMRQSEKGNRPFIIPDSAYDFEKGLDVSKISIVNFNVLNKIL
jgi:CRISPR-associated endonuclease/helicase Cas3